MGGGGSNKTLFSAGEDYYSSMMNKIAADLAAVQHNNQSTELCNKSGFRGTTSRMGLASSEKNNVLASTLAALTGSSSVGGGMLPHSAALASAFSPANFGGLNASSTSSTNFVPMEHKRSSTGVLSNPSRNVLSTNVIAPYDDKSEHKSNKTTTGGGTGGGGKIEDIIKRIHDKRGQK